MKIRQCDLDDLDVLLELNERNIKTIYSQSYWEDLLADNEEKINCLIAEIDGEERGYLIWKYEETHDDETPFIRPLSIVVDEGFRKRGIGCELANEALRRVPGNLRLESKVRVSNKASIAMNKKYGLEKSDTIFGYYGDGEDAIVFRKEKPDKCERGSW